MAQFEQWFSQDFHDDIIIRHRENVMFSGDDKGAIVGVRLYNNETPYSGGGTVSGAVKRSDGGLVALTGTLAGNAASVVIPASALAYPGPIGVRIILTQGGSVTTVLKAIYSVDDNTGAAVDPGTIIPSINDLITAINTAVASIPSDYSALLHTLAPDFSASKAYFTGDYVWYNGTLYRFTSDHAAGSWTGTDAVSAVVGTDLNDLKNALIGYNVFNIPTTEKNGGTRNGVVTTVTGPYSIHAQGTATANWFHNLWIIPTFPNYLKAGDTIYLLCESTQSNVSMQLLTTTDGTNWTIVNRIYGYTEYTIPAGVKGILYRAFAASGVSINADITAGILTNEPLERIPFLRYIGAENNTDLNNEANTGITVLSSEVTYANAPFVGAGYLWTVDASTSVLQLAYKFSGNQLYKRRRNIQNTWENWQLIGGGENTYNNTYNYPIYNNTYTQTVSPTITTDTNAYLAPSGDTSDRTAAILALLNSQGVCRLGKGNYYVNNLTMPKNTMLIGSGAGTKLILSGTGDGYAVKMDDYCSVENMSILGATADITLSETLGGRHGILWQGNYSENQNNELQPNYGIISNLWISGFTGGGITCYNTGYGTYCHLEAVNIYCRNCNAGINIAYWSEFHKFTNCRLFSCYYGCINNGGNNVFSNCDFSSCKQAFLMDNWSGQSPNNGHGTCIGCTFNHTNSNTGIGIKAIGIPNGFIFDGCQIFYSQIELTDCEGFVVSNTNFGANNCNITISGGGAIMFANNMHQAAPTISVTNNQHVHFANCYVRGTGATVSA